MKKFLALLVIILMVGAVFVSCKSTATTETTAAVAAVTTTTEAIAASTTAVQANENQAAWIITIVNGDSSINFTNAEAEKIPTIDMTATMKKKDGSEVEQKWTGIPLKAVFDSLSITDYTKITVEASDNYSVDLDKAMVEDAGTILGLKVDGQALTADTGGPVELVVKSQPGKFWVKSTIKITITK
jgi:DMSO/TMAO reductase YedYZ molybdopterin-dependent catalytic subunit